MLRAATILSLALASATPIAAAPSLKSDAATIDRHLNALASPLSQPRLPGYPGHAAAAKHIEAELRRLALQPAAANDSYRHPLTLAGQREIQTQSLTLHLPTGDVQLDPSIDFNPLGVSASGQLDRAPVTYAGYSIVIADDGYRTYQPGARFNTDEQGNDSPAAIALILTHEPLDEDGYSYYHDNLDEWTYLSNIAAKLAAAQRRGAAAALLVTAPGVNDDTAQDPLAFDPNAPEFQRFDTFPVIALARDAADQLVQGAPPDEDHERAPSLLDLRNRADLEGALVPLDGVAVSLAVELTEPQLDAPILYARVPGVGALAREHVLVIAAYDTPTERDRAQPMPALIRVADPLDRASPGADAVASSAAAALLAAKTITETRGSAPRRSVLFAFLSDSQHNDPRSLKRLTASPPVPFGDVAAAITLGPCAKPTDNEALLFGVGHAHRLDDLLTPALDEAPLTMSTDLDLPPARLHTALTDRRVPTLHLTTGRKPEHATPDDTTANIDSQDAARVAQALAAIIDALARAPERPRYTDSSGNEDRPNARPTAGFRPREAEFLEDDGVYVAATFTGGPADRAGLEPGDRLVAWNDKPVNSIADYAQYLTAARPGDEVDLKLERDGNERRVTLTLDSAG